MKIITKDYYCPYNFYNWPAMNVSVYSEVRCDRPNDENILGMGIYDKKEKRMVASRKIKARQIAGEHFQWVHMFTAPLMPVDQLYLGPLKNDSAGPLWVDRIMVVDEARQP